MGAEAVVGGIGVGAAIFSGISSRNESRRNSRIADEQYQRNQEMFEKTERANREIGTFNIGATEHTRASHLESLYDNLRSYRSSAFVSAVSSGLKLDEDRKFAIDRDVSNIYAKSKEEINFNTDVQIKNIRAQMEGATLASQAQLNQSTFERDRIKSEAQAQLYGGIYNAVRGSIGLHRDLKSLMRGG